jgi:phosphoribosylformimino-5-aminoimidazole carboxamide ribotide isomerase
METFTIYPAIDLHDGQVVRLTQGDPNRQTVYGSDPAGTARRWLEAGASCLHVVNLDGAFEAQDGSNQAALRAILDTAAEYGVKVQFGGGLRTFDAIENILTAGVYRAILGTVAVEEAAAPPRGASRGVLDAALKKFGTERIAVGIDACHGQVKVSGWTRSGGMRAVELARQLAGSGLRTVIYTDIARDGTGSGVNVAASRQLAAATGLEVIASGGVHTLDDIRRVRRAGLSGVIVGRALYERYFSLEEALTC